MMRESSDLRFGVPPWLPFVVLLAAMVSIPARAQDRYEVLRNENFRREPRPDGRLLASVNQGALLTGEETRDGWVQINLEGWIWSRSIRAINATEFDAEVAAAGGENLRAEPNGEILARLSQGFWLEELGRDGDWVHVRRRGWMWGRSLRRMASTAGGSVRTGPDTPPQSSPAPQPTAPPAETRGDTNVGLEFAVAARDAKLRVAPEGEGNGTLKADAPVRIVGRSGAWVRVRAEGWVHEDDLDPGSADVLVGVSGAEVRARPRDFEGRLVQWVVQYIAVQTADDLRREIPAGTQYMLARGPYPEAGFLYILLEPDQVRQLERVSPLAELVVLARIRVGRSQFLGNPVAELVELAVRDP